MAYVSLPGASAFTRFAHSPFGREQHDVLAAVTSHVDSFMGAIHLFGYLGKPSLDFREGHRR